MAKKHKAKKGNKASQTQAAAKSTKKAEVKSAAKKSDSMLRNIVVAGLIIILLLAGIGFLVFGLVQSIRDKDNDKKDDQVETVDDSNDDKDDSDNKDDDKDDSDKTDDNKTDDSKSDDSKTDDTEKNDNKGEVSGSSTSKATTKYARTNTAYSWGNDYKFGDITGSKYTIRRGDTLWQIAEGRYGSGLAWVDVDRANGVFPLLRNGQPNKLTVGQTIVLPNL